MFRTIKLKLAWRIGILSLLATSAFIYVSVAFVLHFTNLEHQEVRRSRLFKDGGRYHLGVIRKLVDKSGVVSNSTAGADVSNVLSRRQKVNNVDEAVRIKHIFPQVGSLEVDFSKDYVNRVFKPSRRDKELFSHQIYDMAPDKLIYHINEYRHMIRRDGARMNIFDNSEVRKRDKKLRDWELWYLNISQYELYRHDDPVVDSILHNMANLPIIESYQFAGGTQIKLQITFSDELHSLWKPMRFTRDTQTLVNHYYFSDYERHTAEIAAFHLDRVFGFRRNPPVVGRIINITADIRPFASVKFLKTIFTSPAGNTCFYGKCSYYCDSGHAICGHPDWVEGSSAALLPDDDFAPRIDRRNPWRRSYSRSKRVQWEDDPNYCKEVIKKPPFDKGRSLADLIDLHIFDFIQGNMDRHHYELFDFPRSWKNDTVPVVLDNGRGWGKMYKDEISILAPLTQCCRVRYSTVQKLLLFDEGPYRLSELLDYSTADDPLYPILVGDHLAAADRRVKIVLKEVQSCIEKHSWNQVVIDDGF